MREFFFEIGRLSAYVIPEKLTYALSKLVGYIRTGYQSKRLAKIGKRVFFYKGVIIKGPENIVFGDEVSIGRNTVLGTTSRIKGITPALIVGDGVSIGSECLIFAANRIQIGKGSLLGSKVAIVDNSHGELKEEQLTISPTKRGLSSKGPVIIGENVWIGDKVTILPGVTIGNSVIIGSNSVVVSDITENSVAVGIPCKVVKRLKK